MFGHVNNRSKDLSRAVLRVGLLLSSFGAPEFPFQSPMARTWSEVLASLAIWNVPL